MRRESEGEWEGCLCVKVGFAFGSSWAVCPQGGDSEVSGLRREQRRVGEVVWLDKVEVGQGGGGCCQKGRGSPAMGFGCRETARRVTGARGLAALGMRAVLPAEQSMPANSAHAAAGRTAASRSLPARCASGGQKKRSGPSRLRAPPPGRQLLAVSP